MGAEFNFKKFSKFLKSFWGILAAFTVLLPSIIYVLKTKQIQDSVLGEYYIGIPTTFTLLVIPFIFLYEDQLSSLKLVRKVSLSFIILALITLFSFLAIKSVFVINKKYSENGSDISNTIIKYEENSNGLIYSATYSLKNLDEALEKEEGINVLELFSLALYSLSIIFLGVSFSTLGVFFYTKSQ